MSIEELKIEIAKKVLETDDENLLSELDMLLNHSEKVVLEELPKHVQEGIKRGLKQAEEGKLIPYDEVKRRLAEKWH
jgi:predicted transcriptional regulator